MKPRETGRRRTTCGRGVFSCLDAVDATLRSQAAHKAGADNCDGRIAEQARAIRFVRRVEARGGIKRWCAAEVFELARLRALVARHRAYAFFPPYLACSRARVYGIFDAC